MLEWLSSGLTIGISIAIVIPTSNFVDRVSGLDVMSDGGSLIVYFCFVFFVVNGTCNWAVDRYSRSRK